MSEKVKRLPLREFLYVDVERTRSFLSQLSQGLVESVVEKSGSATSGEAKAQILGLGAGGQYARDASREETKSVQDLTFVAFEEAAHDAGYLVSAPPEVSDPDAWSDGRVHAALMEGQVIALTCDIHVVDAEFLGARIERVEMLGDALAGLTGQAANQAPTTTKAARRRDGRRPAQMRKPHPIWGDMDPVVMKSLADLFRSFLAGSIAIRVLPCGEDHPEYSFGGSLLSRREYIQEEREALFSRYGSVLRGWTTVIQIASAPEGVPSSELVLDDIQLLAGGGVDRSAIESLALRFSGFLEGMGISEGPRWPSISATVLGIYRTVPISSLRALSQKAS